MKSMFSDSESARQGPADGQRGLTLWDAIGWGRSALAAHVQLSVVLGGVLLGVALASLLGAPARSANEPAPWIQVVLFGVLIPALLEETLFRGVLLRWSAKRWGVWPAILLSASLFALFHPRGPAIFIAFSMGVYMGYWAIRSGSVREATWVHALNNTGAFLPVLLD